ncbi:hypothetical protein MKW98_018925 [Papaver atlanticum]|uniref:Uncharacterized protein n=1 Tax=Papaver atlanticum TaxID=357466 RepID=A0AAD4TGG0_9MAGN|nr:hypothetical protein MKW98_018925 [Papaver atlanticum]
MKGRDDSEVSALEVCHLHGAIDVTYTHNIRSSGSAISRYVYNLTGDDMLEARVCIIFKEVFSDVIGAAYQLPYKHTVLGW